MVFLSRPCLCRLGSAALLAGGAALLGCVPEIDDDLSLVSNDRVLAVVAEPPEAGEGDRVALSALIASPLGSSALASYSFCLTRKPLSELGPVDPSCLSGTGELVDLGRGARVEGVIDRGACSLFGPRRPTPEPGQPAGRPVDPDPTGGFYQPVMATLPGQSTVLGGVRLDCGLPGADRDQVIEYNQRHRPNLNPAVERLELLDAGSWLALTPETPQPVVAGQRRILRVSWPSCTSDASCAGAETYVVLDPESGALADRSEEVLASWYTSGGGFDEPRTGAADVLAPQAENIWQVPLEPGPAAVWVVLRDGRGGIGYANYRFQVE
jgi:hypothetical protein